MKGVTKKNALGTHVNSSEIMRKLMIGNIIKTS